MIGQTNGTLEQLEKKADRENWRGSAASQYEKQAEKLDDLKYELREAEIREAAKERGKQQIKEGQPMEISRGALSYISKLMQNRKKNGHHVMGLENIEYHGYAYRAPGVLKLLRRAVDTHRTVSFSTQKDGDLEIKMGNTDYELYPSYDKKELRYFKNSNKLSDELRNEMMQPLSSLL